LGEDAEELHDMRVATRRTRAALSLFEDALPVRSRHVRTELGWLADALGAVRDLDVQLERLEGWIQDVPSEDRAALADLRALLRRERDEARRLLLVSLDSARYERLVAGFTAMLRQGPSRRSAAARAPAGAVVPSLIEARHRSATKSARRARRSGDPADYHQTRIRLKRLRYALEFVSEIYERRTGKYLRHVVRLQDVLGLMQDARVAGTRLHELATAQGSGLSPTTVFVMGGVSERYRSESESLARKVPHLLKELGGPEWRKLSALMERRRLELSAQYPWPGSSAIPPGGRTGTPTVPGSTVAPAAASSDPGPRTQPIPAVSLTPAVPPAAAHPAASRPVPARLTSPTWSSDPAPRTGSGEPRRPEPDDLPRPPGPPPPMPTVPAPASDSEPPRAPSSNGEGPRPEDR
jgi:CHAD domain-containing protein